MKPLRKLLIVAVSILSATLFAADASAQTSKPAEARNVVLVHGAWADGSSWAEVISRLQAAGLHVTAVQNPLTSLADSVAATRRALALPCWSPIPGVGPSSAKRERTRKSPHLSTLQRVHPTRGKISSHFPESFPPCRCAQVFRNAMGSLFFPRRHLPNISRTASRATRQKFFMPNKNRPLPLCSAGAPPRLLGVPNQAGMRYRNSIKRYRLTWNDFWQHA